MNRVRVFDPSASAMGGWVVAMEQFLQREIADVPLENVRVFPLDVDTGSGLAMSTFCVIYDPVPGSKPAAAPKPCVRRIQLRRELGPGEPPETPVTFVEREIPNVPEGRQEPTEELRGW